MHVTVLNIFACLDKPKRHFYSVEKANTEEVKNDTVQPAHKGCDLVVID